MREISWNIYENQFIQDPLVIQSFGFADEGEYVCTVKNEWGMTMTTSIVLSIDYGK